MINMSRPAILVCAGGSGNRCDGGKALKLTVEFQKEVEARGLADKIQVGQSSCYRMCKLGPNVGVFPEGTVHSGVSVGDVKKIVSEVEESLAENNSQ